MGLLSRTLAFISSTFLLDDHKYLYLQEKKLFFYMLLAYPQQPQQVGLLLEAMISHFREDEAMVEIFYEGISQIFGITDDIRYLAPVRKSF